MLDRVQTAAGCVADPSLWIMLHEPAQRGSRSVIAEIEAFKTLNCRAADLSAPVIRRADEQVVHGFW